MVALFGAASHIHPDASQSDQTDLPCKARQSVRCLDDLRQIVPPRRFKRVGHGQRQLFKRGRYDLICSFIPKFKDDLLKPLQIDQHVFVNGKHGNFRHPNPKPGTALVSKLAAIDQEKVMLQ